MTDTNRVFLTGASSGIGRALAMVYARRGATLGLLARRGEILDQLAASLPTRTYCYTVDVRDAAALSAAGNDFMERVGCPDVVIANAGVSSGTATENEADAGVFEEILATNVTGVMQTFQPFINAMQQQKRGTLAGVASVAGFRGLPGAVAYCASKAAAITYLESLRLELRESDVRVVTLCPGYIDTRMTRVNPYRMPFPMDVQAAAGGLADAIDSGMRFKVLPWQMAVVGWVLRRLPCVLYDFAFAGAPRKPRCSRADSGSG